FLSLEQESNILGWLELRSFLELESNVLFSEQRLPIISLQIVSVTLALFMVYRAYFVAGSAFSSTLWNGMGALCFLCLIALFRIAALRNQFNDLQLLQQLFVSEQIIYLQCKNNPK